MAELKPINPTALLLLKAHRKFLTVQQYRTLRGQVLAGDDKGAVKGLSNIMGRLEVKDSCR